MDQLDRLVIDTLSVASEAKIRANGDQETATPGWLILDTLADQVYRAVLTATTDLYSKSKLDEICQAADVAAIGRIAKSFAK